MFTNKRNPAMLKEHLIDENDVELTPRAAPPTTADDVGAEIDDKIREWGILDETYEEKKKRLMWDNRIMLGYTCVVATAGECEVYSSVGIFAERGAYKRI